MAVSQGDRVGLSKEVITDFLASARAFQGADRGLLDRIAPHAQVARFGQGGAILSAGKPSVHIGLVYEGRASVRLVNAVTGEAVVIHDLRPGDHFGEVGALLDSAQPFEVVAEAPTTVVWVPRNLVDALAAKTTHFPLAMAKALASRLVRATMSMSSTAPRSAAAPAPAAPTPAAQPALQSLGFGDVTPFVRTASFDITDQLVSLLPVETILQHRVLPLRMEGKTVTLGMVDPYHQAAKTEVDRILHNIELEIAAISQDDFMSALVRLRLDAGQRSKTKESLSTSALSYEKDDQEREAEHKLEVIGHEVVGIVDKILVAGIERGASDIHIEEQRADVKVRFRINGMLHDYREYIPASFARGIAARIKVLAGLDITERRRPQDGRVGLRVGRRDIDFRVSTLPAGRGEKVVMRMFEASNMMRPLDQIFIEPRTIEFVRDTLARPYGAIIVAGATGSGKSSTLYACLHELKLTRPDSNICVVEDPIEYRLQGVTQVQVNHAVELGFSTALRSFLRQDPDVIMVGEMRDAETAKIGLEAAMTGHLVFTSFHANNVTASVQRLENFGCNRTMIAQSLALVLVQRLVRRLCAQCAIVAPAAPVLVKSLVDRGLIEPSASVQLPKPRGCERCDNTGYAGRVAVLECLKVTEEIATQLMADVRLDEIEKHATAKGVMIPFRQYASFLMARKVIAPGDALLTVAG